MANRKRRQKTAAQLTDILKEMLAKPATMKLLEKCAPDLLKQLQAGMTAPTVARLLAHKVLELALDPEKINRWAIDLVWDRVEGRPAQGALPEAEGRDIDAKLDDVSRKHLESISASFARRKSEPVRGQGTPEDASNEASGSPSSGRDGLPDHKPVDPEDPPGQSEVADATPRPVRPRLRLPQGRPIGK